ncbi:GatB/YqeY domain-containing protein [Streptomyces sp. NPDC055078]
MKARDRVAVSVLRSTLGAIENAEAVVRPVDVDRNLAMELIPRGVGAAEAERLELTEGDVVEIVRAEVAEREAAAREYEGAGRAEQADRLREEIRVLAAHL